MNVSDAERVARAVAELADVLNDLGYVLYDYPAGLADPRPTHDASGRRVMLWAWSLCEGVGQDSRSVAWQGGYSGSRAALGGAADDAIARWRAHAQSLGQEATK